MKIKTLLHSCQRTALLLIALFAIANTVRAYDFEEGGIYYNLNEDGTTVTVTFETTSYNSYSGDVIIPDFVTHDGTTYTVTAIGEYAFMQSPDLTGIVISDSVKTVGRLAFRNCTGLRRVTIGKSITTLSPRQGHNVFHVFSGCKGITSLTWNAVNCADNGGMGTTYLYEVTIGDEVQVIPDNFAKESEIFEVVIPNSVVSIGSSAFQDCYYLQNMTFRASVISIGASAFKNCHNLDITSLGDAVTTIGKSAFQGCYSIKEIDLGQSLTSISESSFESCSSLQRIEIPNTVTAIGGHAFKDCSSLTEVTMGNSVATIATEAFNGCSRLTKVNISSVEAWCGIQFDDGSYGNNYIGQSNPLYYAHHLYLNSQEVKDLIIPNTITAINDCAFYGGSGFTSVTLGDAVTTIGGYAFYGCSGFTSVTLGDSIVSIGLSAFQDCTGLTNVTIGGGLTAIGSDAFRGCSSLTSFTLGKSVTQIGRGEWEWGNILAFCTNLTSLAVESGNPVYDSRDNCNAIIETSTNTLLVGCPTTVIPNTVTSIDCMAFYGCDGLTSIVIPKSVTSIGVETNVYQNDTTYYYCNPFMHCSGLKSVTVESGNPLYDSRDNCNAIIETATNTLIVGCQTTVIPNSVTSIGQFSFDGCRSLTSIDIPNSVTTIGDDAFMLCTGLTNVTIPNSVTSIGWDAFYGCQSLKSIDIPNSVIAIGDYAFANCTSLTSAVIPNSVVGNGNEYCELATAWFMGCTGLERVTIGSGIALMGILFWECPNITSVTCLAVTPPSWVIYANAQRVRLGNFDNVVVLSQATLYVPANSLEAYQTASYWKNFQDIRPLGDADGDGALSIGDVTDLIDYLLSGSGNGLDMGAADVDGDGSITIADVTDLIDTLLHQ